jgi:hypothetical protein
MSDTELRQGGDCRRALIERLAETLHDEMEHLDPIGSDWHTLTDFDREYYRSCAGHMLAELRDWDRKRPATTK